MVERYCAATGRDSLPDLNWYFAYNFFRLTGILQGIKKRVIDGTANSAHAKDMSDRVTPLADRASSPGEAHCHSAIPSPALVDLTRQDRGELVGESFQPALGLGRLGRIA